MLTITVRENGEIVLSGRFDASQTSKAQDVFSSVSQSTVVDFGDLDYISSAGLGVLVATHRRLSEIDAHLTLRNMNEHIRNIFGYSGLDRLFEIELS